ncbi:MAG: SNF2-related protein [Nitrospira sp.]|nr:SNF2-related protein [Nitrospira sp.]
MIGLTPYHAKYFAHELTKRCPSDSIEKLASALVDAQVDLNPHQVEAALFAFRSPLSKGALLADEVGLGKTIEAGLVLSQKWAERKRQVLIITPSNLRKQWHQELQEKFFLPCRILETKSYNEAVRQGNVRPFECSDIVICSYQFARSKAAEISLMRWDLVVIDEAHRLRNVYKPTNVIANTIKHALKDAPKLLLTATPLQNSLLELYGLVSVVDDRIFGDLKSFKEQFANLHNQATFDTLKARLQPLCKRTLRRQVLPYVRYTKRLPMMQPFTPAENEDRLYHLVSDYLRRDNLQALPSSQRSLMTLVLRKLLASSSFAIAGALNSMSQRLRERLRQADGPNPLEEALEEDFEALEGMAEEWDEEEAASKVLTEADRKAIQQEIDDLEGFRKLAVSIVHNAKGQELLTALRTAFGKAEELGAAQKAIIFTESRRTQEYLLRVLADSPWKDYIVQFNGSNNDEKSKQIYQTWLQRHQNTDRVTGSRSADMRSALVDYFKKPGQIMIATEAGSEGINLQFCSLVVNYDLPWNPQRIEQRIGRCHRYGQRHDVVVVNFLNQNNEADQHVFRLLSEKFQLFEGVFGASDEVLGAIESGVDFEKRIADIYQRCRTPHEIKVSFDQLQSELGSQIDEAMTKARQLLFEHFDDEVREKLRVSDENSRLYLNRYERILMQLTRYELRDHADFFTDSSFKLQTCPFEGEIPLGLYELPRRTGEVHLYRLAHPLAEQVVGQAKGRLLESAELTFEYRKHDGKVTVVEPLIGKSGILNVSLFTVEALDQAEDYLICTGVTEQGEVLDEEVVQRLFSLPGTISQTTTSSLSHPTLRTRTEERQDAIRRQISKRNAEFFEIEVDKLDSWADDLKVGLEREIKEFDRQIKEARRAAVAALTLEEKLAGQKQIKAIEAERGKRRRALFDAQDEIDSRREQLINEIEGKLQQKASSEHLFAIRWQVR